MEAIAGNMRTGGYLVLTPGHGWTKAQHMSISDERMRIADRRSSGDTRIIIVYSGSFWRNAHKCSRVETLKR